MAQYDLGSAVGTIVLKSDTKGVGQAESSMSALGKTGDVAGKLVKSGLVAVAAAAATVATAVVAAGGAIFKMGFDRAVAIDNAEAKMRGLGYSTEQVEGIMQNALAAVKGTAFGLDEAAGLAATAVAAGIEPGAALQRQLTLTANAAAAAGTDMNDLGGIMRKVWTDGRVDMEVINQLGDRGIPIFSKLAEAYGVSGTELRSMVASGQVDMETFTATMEASVGSVAAAMGTTFTGATQNAGAALSRLGALFASPVMEALTPILLAATEAIDKFAQFVAPAEEALAGYLAPAVESVVAALAGIDFTTLDFGSLITMFASVRDQLIAMAPTLIQGLITGIVSAIPAIIAAIGSLITTIISAVVAAAPLILQGGVQLVVALIQGLITTLPDLFLALIEGLGEVSRSIIEAIPMILDAATQLFMMLVDALPVILPKLVQTLIDVLTQNAETIVSMLPKILQSAVELFTALVESLPIILPLLIRAILDLLPKIISTLLNMIPTLISTAVELFVSLVKAIPKIIPDLVSSLLDLLPEIIGTIIGMIPDLIQAGIDLIGGLVSGLWEAAGSVASALLDIIGGAVDGFLDFLGIHSPSRLFRGYGENVVAGLIRGLDGMDDALTSSVASLGTTMSAEMQHSMETANLEGLLSSAAEGKTNNLTYVNQGTPGLDSEDELFSAMRRAKVIVPSW
ncbi:tape measure protein [Microbacterium sp. KKR3/1]|uniref:phage tail protein n=1 Tax=Microbacterium sp. KKR3/1 TaxID=2904241 RepID=UPI001E46099F|nr:tape measure protein [Microbacterium sp. KKR3/1]MCE0507954.1 tape measure protein [Microbacterium sp. KKR3/1]